MLVVWNLASGTEDGGSKLDLGSLTRPVTGNLASGTGCFGSRLGGGTPTRLGGDRARWCDLSLGGDLSNSGDDSVVVSGASAAATPRFFQGFPQFRSSSEPWRSFAYGRLSGALASMEPPGLLAIRMATMLRWSILLPTPRSVTCSFRCGRNLGAGHPVVRDALCAVWHLSPVACSASFDIVPGLPQQQGALLLQLNLWHDGRLLRSGGPCIFC